MREEDLEKAYPYVDDEGRRYRLIGGGAAASPSFLQLQTQSSS